MEGFFDGRLNFFFCFDFCYAKAGTAGIRFDKTRQTDFADYFLVGDFKPFAENQRFGYSDSETFQILVASELIECYGRNQYITTGVRNPQQVKVTLQDTVLTRSAVNGDISEIEKLLFAILHESEVVTVDGSFSAVGQYDFPTVSFHLYYI